MVAPLHINEDKQFWIAQAGWQEPYFVEQVAPHYGLNAMMNPEKAHNPYAPDLVVDGYIAELKTRETPLYTAQSVHGFDPQYAITFNVKDFERYIESYPHIVIYFWVDWKGMEESTYPSARLIKPMRGVWCTDFMNIALMVSNGLCGYIEYKQRKGDTRGNGKDSYIFDVRQFRRCTPLQVIE